MTGKILEPACVGFADSCSLSVDLQEGGKVSLLAMEEYEPVYGLLGQEFDAEAAWVYMLTGTYTQEDDTLILKLNVMRERMLVRGEEAGEFRNAYIEYLRNEFSLSNAASLFSEKGITDPDFDVLTEVQIDVSLDDWKWILSKSYNSDGSLYSECYYADDGNIFVDNYYDYRYLVNRTEYSQDGIKLLWTSFEKDGEEMFHYEYYDDGSLKFERFDGKIYEAYDRDGTEIKHDEHHYVDGVCDFCGDVKAVYSGGLALKRYSDHCVVVGLAERYNSDLVIPAEYNGVPVTSIAGGAFDSCTSLTSITIPNSVTSIRSYTFGVCSSLTGVVLGNGVTSIGELAFCCCTSLTSITLPNSISSIDYAAFGECSSLTDIVYTGTMAQWNAIEKHSEWASGVPTSIVHCADGDVSIY